MIKHTRKPLYKLENIIEKVEEGGYGEEIEETGEAGGVEAEEGEDVGAYITGTGELKKEMRFMIQPARILAPNQKKNTKSLKLKNMWNTKEILLLILEIEPEEEDEKEFIRDASDIGSYVRIS